MTVRISRRDVLRGTLAALPFAFGSRSAAGPGQQPRTAGAGAWTLPAKRPIRIVEHQWITLADGTRLASRLWIPEGAEREPVPVVWNYLPYRLRDGTAPTTTRGAGSWPDRHRLRARRRARHGGLRRRHGGRILPSGADGWRGVHRVAGAPALVERGVGMRGLSWGGINTLQVAALDPPALKAILPMGCCDDRYTDDAHYIGGASAAPTSSGACSFKTVMAGPPDPRIAGPEWERQWRQRLEATPSILATWVSHQRYDGTGNAARRHRLQRNPRSRLRRGGWRTPTERRRPASGEAADSAQGADRTVGPHLSRRRRSDGLDWAHEEVRWWEHWLKGSTPESWMSRCSGSTCTIPRRAGSPAEIPGRWVAEQVWPAPRTHPYVCYLDAGRFSSTAGSRDRVAFAARKIVGLTKPEWLGGPPGDQTRDDRKSLTFDSAPLEADMEILGYPTAGSRSAPTFPWRRSWCGSQKCAGWHVVAGELRVAQPDAPLRRMSIRLR